MISLKDLTWTPMSLLRESDPKSLCHPTLGEPRLARDETYAKDIIKAWKADTDISSKSNRNNIDTLVSPFSYKDTDGIDYAGNLVIPSSIDVSKTLQKLPVVVLFHTGAGPQDIFNMYKADKLCREKFWGASGCLVFIADILSDSSGWSWGDRDRYWKLRSSLNEVTNQAGKNCRWKLRNRVSAALNAVKSIDAVDSNKIAAWGFCLGGQPVLELARMQPSGVLGLITFHGLFDGVSLPDQETPINCDTKRRVLVCSGKGDPYNKASDLDLAKETFEHCGWSFKLRNFENVLHNFSNPRTEYDGEGFGYDENAAIASWDSAIELLKDVFQL